MQTKKQLDQVASIGCILCQTLGYGATPAELHHIRRYGAPRDASPVIPLCPEHHRGKSGVHGLGRKAFESKYGLTENDLLATVQALLKKSR